MRSWQQWLEDQQRQVQERIPQVGEKFLQRKALGGGEQRWEIVKVEQPIMRSKFISLRLVPEQGWLGRRLNPQKPTMFNTYLDDLVWAGKFWTTHGEML